MDDHTRARELFDATSTTLVSEGYKCSSSMAKHLVANLAIEALREKLAPQDLRRKIREFVGKIEDDPKLKPVSSLETELKRLINLVRVELILHEEFARLTVPACEECPPVLDRRLIGGQLSDHAYHSVCLTSGDCDLEAIREIAEKARMMVASGEISPELVGTRAASLASSVLSVI